ncbi:hypothetical protein MKW92_003225 [Papaver armeniacum]|nr:hypothetical protein MKW92_003225 [Papaver armeniacum]
MGGCTASKLDNEDTVRRCKERKRLIKDAVNARHHLSAAHSDYLRSLRLTGSALLEFASGEPLSVSNQTPTVFLTLKNPTSFAHKITLTPRKVLKTHSSPLNYSYFDENDECSSTLAITRSKELPHIWIINRKCLVVFIQAATSSPEGRSWRKKKGGTRYSEWGDHYSTTSSDTDDENDDDDEEDLESKILKWVLDQILVHLFIMVFDAGSSVSWNMGNKSVHNHGGSGSGVNCCTCIKEYFEKAAVAGEPVSDLPEVSRAQLDRSFRQLKISLDKFEFKLDVRNLHWRLSIDWILALPCGARSKSHFSTLEQLLAWEKKLYQEVKAREGANIEHEKKLSTLQSLEYRGGGEAKLDKTKASIKKLQSMILVTSQSVSSTSSAIVQVRDTELTPQLWKQALDRLPDTVASESIKSFVNVVHRGEISCKELERRLRPSDHRKFYQSYSMVGIAMPDIFDARDPLSEKMDLAACQRKAVEVTRAMTLNNIQTGLPGVFQSMTMFSSLFNETLQGVLHSFLLHQ